MSTCHQMSITTPLSWKAGMELTQNLLDTFDVVDSIQHFPTLKMNGQSGLDSINIIFDTADEVDQDELLSLADLHPKEYGVSDLDIRFT